MRIVVSKGHTRGVQAQGVTRDGAGNRTGHGRPRGRRRAIVGLGQGAANAGGDSQCLGGDGRCGILDHRCIERVVCRRAVGVGRADGERAVAGRHNPVGGGDVGGVVGQADARGVQVQRVARDGPGHRARHSGASGGRGAVIGFAEGTTNGGRAGQGLGRDRSGGVGNGGCAEAVVTGHTVGRGRTDGERTGSAGRDGCGTGHVCIVVGQGHAGCIEAQRIARDATRDVARNGGAGGGDGAIIGFGDCPANAGGGSQGPGCDGADDISNHGRGETVIARHAVVVRGRDVQCAVATGHDGRGGANVSAVVGQRDPGSVEAQCVACHSTGDRTQGGCTGGGRGAIVGFGECAANAGRGRQGLGGNGGIHVGNGRCCEAVIAGHAVAGRGGNGQSATAGGSNLRGRGDVGIVIGQRDARGVQAQGVTRYGAADRTDHGGARGGGGAVIGLGERAANAGRGGQGFRSDGGRGICNDGRAEAVVACHTVVRGRVDGKRAAATGHNFVGRSDVGVVVGQADAGSVQAQRVAIEGSAHRARHGCTGGGGGAVVGFGERAANAGRGGQRLGRDVGNDVADGGRGETVVASHTVAARCRNVERAAARGHHRIGCGHVGTVVGQGDARGVQAEAVA